jgi:dihydropteroate synthase
MLFKKDLNFRSMGVINITPNSFSDGGEFNKAETFKKRFEESTQTFDIIDIGAESTAPFNDVVSESEELKRYELFDDYIANHPDPEISLSIDTYKPAVFVHVYHTVKKNWPKTTLIWNDVSGKLDEEFLNVVDELNNDFEYVFCHNLVPERSQAAEHMNYTVEGNVSKHILDYFKADHDLLKQCEIKYYFDPCFGFSKTREQNHELLRDMPMIMDLFKGVEFVYGISRKSFLRFPPDENIRDPKVNLEVEALQTLFLNYMAGREMVIRAHSLSPLKSVLNFHKLTHNS